MKMSALHSCISPTLQHVTATAIALTFVGGPILFSQTPATSTAPKAAAAPAAKSGPVTKPPAGARGFATAQTNTGHDAAVEPLATFAATPQKVVDYAFRAVHVTTVTARALLEAYYAAPARRAYFDGCSTGGRQGLIAAQRFPDDFDGIVNGAPVLNFSGTMIGYVKDQKALAVAPLGPEAIATVGNAVLAKCDAMDGIKDGVVDDPRKCAFTPATDIQKCSNDTAAAGCLTAAQVHAVEVIYSPVQRNGAAYFPGWPVGAEVAGPSGQSGWIGQAINGPNGPGAWTSYGYNFLRFMAPGVLGGKVDNDPAVAFQSFDIDSAPAKAEDLRNIIDASDPDLTAFRKHGGKLLMYFGWADPQLNPRMGVEYYEQVSAVFGDSTSDFFRLFMVPGMFHCGGGVGTSQFDATTPLLAWVEESKAPSRMEAARVVQGSVVRTRPLCAWPEVAKYKGTGSIDDSANFTCAKP